MTVLESHQLAGQRRAETGQHYHYQQSIICIYGMGVLHRSAKPRKAGTIKSNRIRHAHRRVCVWLSAVCSGRSVVGAYAQQSFGK